MARPLEMQAFYDSLAEQQANLLASIRPLNPEQMRLRAAPGEWAIWQLASNMAGGRLYWLCRMLGEDDLGLSGMFRVDHATVPGIDLQWAGWEDNEDRPRTAEEITDAFEKTWEVIAGCLDRWTREDLTREVTNTDAWGGTITITPSWVIARLFAHEVHHGSEISLILRVHGLPTAINGWVHRGVAEGAEKNWHSDSRRARRIGSRSPGRARMRLRELSDSAVNQSPRARRCSAQRASRLRAPLR